MAKKILFNPTTGKLDFVSVETETDPVFGASEAANFVAGDKNKLDGIATGAEVNVNADWNAGSGDAQILNKPSIPTQYTDEMAQDAVGNSVGTGLDYDDATGAISVDKTELSLSASDVGLGSVNNSSTTNGMWESSGGNTQLKTADDVDFAKYKAIQMACDNGTSFPASPNTGQWFYRSDIKTLFIYEAAWKSIISFGAVTLYVDGTNGSDAVGKGYSSGSGATKTVQYAIDLIPPINGGNVIVNVSAGTFNETIILQGKTFSGAFNLTLKGTMGSSLSSGTATSVSTYSNGAQATLTDSGKNWSVNAYTRKILRITGGAGYNNTFLWKNDYIIESNTATILTLIGAFFYNYDTTTTYEIIDYLTIIDPGSATTYAIIANGQNNFVIQQLKFNLTSANNTGAVQFVNNSSGKLFTCDSYSSTTIGFAMYSIANFSTCLNANALYGECSGSSGKGFALTYNSQTSFATGADQFYGLTNSWLKTREGIYLAFNGYFMYNSGYSNKLSMNGTGHGITVIIGSYADLFNNIVDMSGTSSGYGFLLNEGSRARIRGGNDIFSAASDGIFVGILSLLYVSTSGSKVRNNGGWGVNTSDKSLGKLVSSNITYSGNASGTYTADASSTNT